MSQQPLPHDPTAPPSPDYRQHPGQGWHQVPPALLKNPFLAGLLSIFPGLGNIYNGLYLRGVAFFVAFATCIGMLDRDGGPVFGISLAFVYIFNVVDAVRQASLINLGLTSDPAADYKPTPLSAGGGTALAGLLLFGVGVMAMLDRWFDIDLTWMAEAWPVIPMGIGAWLLFLAIRDRTKTAPIDTE